MLLRFGCFVMVTMIWIDVGGSTLCLLNPVLKDPLCCTYNGDDSSPQKAFILGKLPSSLNVKSAFQLSRDSGLPVNLPHVRYRVMAALANNNPNNEEVFVYMGGDMIVPRDVVRVRVHPSVTVIPNDAFDECVKLEDVEFCEGLLEIGKGAFHACTSLKGIKIPSTVTVICGRAFVYCSGLEEVELSEGLQEIREAAFFSCYRLKNIAIPTTVQQIGEAAFEEVPLQSIKLPDGLENIGPCFLLL